MDTTIAAMTADITPAVRASERIPARAAAMLDSLSDTALFDLARTMDRAADTKGGLPTAEQQNAWLVRYWAFDALDRRGMLVDTDQDFEIVVNGTRYDSITLDPIA